MNKRAFDRNFRSKALFVYKIFLIPLVVWIICPDGQRKEVRIKNYVRGDEIMLTVSLDSWIL